MSQDQSNPVARAIRAAEGRAITGLAIAARVDLSAHALNNEGSRNNQMLPRQVNVVAGDDVVETNAISGDSLKHGFVDYLRGIIVERAGRGQIAELPICEPCLRSSPNRLNDDKSFQDTASSKIDNAALVGELIRRCVIDDVAGLLVTTGKRNAPRRSTVQFGWSIGIPERVRTGRYTHVKLVPSDPTTTDDQSGANLGQNIFSRPASSGTYAFLVSCDLARIGVNDMTHQPVLDPAERHARARAVLEALYLTLAVPTGAQRNTQLPHLQKMDGAICISYSTMPPVLFSPLAAGFVDEMERCAGAFGRLGSDLHVLRFETLGDLGETLTRLSNQPLAAI
jgi:CRISPR-associated protein Cst2